MSKRRQRPALPRAERVSSVLRELLQEPGLGQQISRHQAWLIWDKLVGEQIAARARPRRLRQGVLEVAVDHPVWMQQLHMLKPKILEKLNQQLPQAGISDIYLRQSRSHDRPAMATRAAGGPPPWRKLELTPAEQQSIEKKLQPLKDPSLKAELREVLIRQTQLEKSRR